MPGIGPHLILQWMKTPSVADSHQHRVGVSQDGAQGGAVQGGGGR